MTAITPERVAALRERLATSVISPWWDGSGPRPVGPNDSIPIAAGDLTDLLDERERMGHELARWEENFPCDGMCSPNDGPQEDCSRHGRAPKDPWDIVTRLTAENNSMRPVAEIAGIDLVEGDSRPRCGAHMNVAGETFQCDYASDHGGWAHASEAASAIWEATPIVPASDALAERVAQVIYRELTDNYAADWYDLDGLSRTPWLDTARAALEALGRSQIGRAHV